MGPGDAGHRSPASSQSVKRPKPDWLPALLHSTYSRSYSYPITTFPLTTVIARIVTAVVDQMR